MAEAIYEVVEIEDMTFNEWSGLFQYPCPCGDMFEVHVDYLRNGDTDLAVCPSCSLIIRVIFDLDDLPPPVDDPKVMDKIAEEAPMAVATAA